MTVEVVAKKLYTDVSACVSVLDKVVWCVSIDRCVKVKVVRVVGTVGQLGRACQRGSRP